MNQGLNTKISNSQYDSLINDYSKNSSAKEKSITSGKIVSIENDIVTIDVGLKSEGRVPLNEFNRPGQSSEIQVGDEIEVFIENVDNANGETLLSREKAVKQKAWHNLQESFNENKVVTGIPFNRVKGGMSVDLDGVVAFLPGSQIETRQIIKDTKELLNKPLELLILKMDKYRGNIVVSRKATTPSKSTLMPPFTLLKGTPVTTLFSLKLSCKLCHACCFTAFSLDNNVSPFALSTLSIKTSISSPT